MTCFALASAQTAEPTATSANLQNVNLAAGESTVTGRLRGSTDHYYLMQKDGTERLLMGHNKELGSYVGHWVELAGNR